MIVPLENVVGKFFHYRST